MFSIQYPIRPHQRSLLTAQVADLFGLPEQEPPHRIVENLHVPIAPGQLVLISGMSGAGKSSILRALAAEVNALDAMSVSLPEVPLIEALPGSLEERLNLLSACGLSEARLFLRLPSELSDGQRYRFRMAYSFAQAVENRDRFLQLDEFAAVLDRTLAKVLAFNLRRLVDRLQIGVLCATTHDDLQTDLNPDTWVDCRGDGEVIVTQFDVKKKTSRSATNFGSAKAPVPTGRTSLAGITAATISASPNE